jgi:hypothetical protein
LTDDRAAPSAADDMTPAWPLRERFVMSSCMSWSGRQG